MALELWCHCWHMQAHLSPFSFLKSTTEAAGPPAPAQGHLSGIAGPVTSWWQVPGALQSHCAPSSTCSPLTRVNLSPEGGRELSVLQDQPHLTEPQPSQGLEAAGRESRSCPMALCALPRLAAPAGSQPLLVMCCTDTSRAGRTLSAHLQDSNWHSGGIQRMAVASQDHQFNSASCRRGGHPWLAPEHECRRLKKTWTWC